MLSDMDKLAEHKAKNPVGGEYLNTPCPLPSALPADRDWETIWCSSL